MYFIQNFARTLAVATLCVVASGCAYVIPPDQNAPRNNTVGGPMRKPQNNPTNPRAVKPQAAVNTAPSANPYSPVQSAAPAQAEQQMASLAAPTAPVTAMPTNSERRMPVENAQVAAAGYPPIDAVPPRPATEGPESVKQRMNDAQQSLEQGRATAAQSKEKLSQDLSAEPSMLSDMPKTQTPSAVSPAPVQQPVMQPAYPQPMQQPVVRPGASAQPVYSQPVAQVQPQPAPQNIVVSASQPPALPPAPNFAPPPPAAGQSAALQPIKPQPLQATVRQVPAPALAAVAPSRMPEPTGAMEPTSVAPLPSVNVGLPPAAASTEVESVVSGDTMTVARTHPTTGVTVRKGDFDPLAAADNAPVASSAVPVSIDRTSAAAVSSSYVANRYMAPSRYYDQR